MSLPTRDDARPTRPEAVHAAAGTLGGLRRLSITAKLALLGCAFAALFAALLALMSFAHGINASTPG